MTETNPPILFTTITIPAAITLRLTVLSGVAEYTRTTRTNDTNDTACDPLAMLTLADWVLADTDPNDTDKPAADAPTTGEVNAMLREAAARQREDKDPRPFEDGDVVTIDDGARSSEGGVQDGGGRQWTVATHGGDGTPDDDGDIRLTADDPFGVRYVLPEHLTLVSPQVTPEPDSEPRAWEAGDLVDIAHDAMYLTLNGSAATTGRNKRGIITAPGTRASLGNVTVSVNDSHYSVQPEFLALVTPAAP